jgi:hypothetical protein
LLARLAALQQQLDGTELVVILEGAARGAVSGDGSGGVASGDEARGREQTSGSKGTSGPEGTSRPERTSGPEGASEPRAAGGFERVGEAGASSGVGPEGGDGAAGVGGVRVVLASGLGDDTIVSVAAEVVARADQPAVTVVTADRGLRQRVEEVGATTVGPGWLLDQLDGLP